jgi:RimJ/RimL family protein N-acetyltransferase
MLKCRKATAGDVLRYFDMANDEEVRKQSFQSGKIDLEAHKKWFLQKLGDADCLMLLFEDEQEDVIGQVRFQKADEEGFSIGISVNAAFRNKGFAARILNQATDHFFELFPSRKIYAYIKADNAGSIRSFEKAGFIFTNKLTVAGNESVLYTKNNQHANR